MIITRADNNVQLHLRNELYLIPHKPIVEMTVVRNNLALEPTIELTYEQTQELVGVLQRLLTGIDEHAKTLEVTQMHPRADALLSDADTTSSIRWRDLPLDANATGMTKK